MKVTTEDFKKAKENVLYRKNEGTPDGLYLWTFNLLLLSDAINSVFHLLGILHLFTVLYRHCWNFDHTFDDPKNICVVDYYCSGWIYWLHGVLIRKCLWNLARFYVRYNQYFLWRYARVQHTSTFAVCCESHLKACGVSGSITYVYWHRWFVE